MVWEEGSAQFIVGAEKIKGQNHLFLWHKKRVKRDAQENTKNNGFQSRDKLNYAHLLRGGSLARCIYNSWHAARLSLDTTIRNNAERIVYMPALARNLVGLL